MISPALEADIFGSAYRQNLDLGASRLGFVAPHSVAVLVPALAMMFLWNEGFNPENMTAYAKAAKLTYPYKATISLLFHVLLRHGVEIWRALVGGCGLTIILHVGMKRLGPRFPLQL